MFEVAAVGTTGSLDAVLASLRGLDQDVDDAVRVDRIRVLEEIKSAAAAAQAVETAAFARSQRAAQIEAGVPAQRASRGIAGQVGLAKRQSPFHATRYVGWCTILTGELPATFAVLAAGAITEWRAMIVARETAWLSREHRALVDRAVAPSLTGWGDGRVAAETKMAGYRLDPHGYLARIAAAAAGRHVSVRPAPEGMCRLTATVALQHGVAAYAALRAHADTLIAAGDPRPRGQLMADTLFTRVTGQQTTDTTDVAVEIQLLMTDRTLLGHPSPRDQVQDSGRDEPAVLVGYGPIPADTARRLTLHASRQTPIWIRRLYRHPTTGQLAAMDSRRRCFTPAQRHFIQLRDHTCRTPWCDAPIRHTDHINPHATGGETTTNNAQGYCATCNHTKQAPGWTTQTDTTDTATVTTTTPTGHTYTSRPPDPPGTARRREAEPGAVDDEGRQHRAA